MAQNPRTGYSGYAVKTGSAKNPYLKQTSGYVVRNTGQGNLSTQVPVFNDPSLNYSAPIKNTTSGDITAAP